MREILFRGKCKCNGEWIEGFLFEKQEESVTELCISRTPLSANDYSEIMGDWCEVIPETVGQYTGLTDKNGTKIFEGDIVSQIWYNYHEPIRDSLGEVIFNELNSSFSVIDVKKDAIFPFNPFSSYAWEIEVIDNVYENKDLLKSGDEE